MSGAIDTPIASTVVADFGNAYSAVDSLNPACDGVVPITSATLAPGVYCAPAAVTLGAGVIFTLSGTANDVWVFRIGTLGTGALTGTGFQVVMSSSAQACNVYWRTADAATLTDSDFKGTILSGAAITTTRGSYEGRALSSTNVTVTNAAPMLGCAASASITVNKSFSPVSGATVPVALTCTSG
ncbi:MAG: ice-binding family protein, partial [Betaproteobacteria bacterium]